MYRQTGWTAFLCLVGSLSSPFGAAAASGAISYPNFSTTAGLNLVGSASTVTGFGGNTVLRLTPASIGQGGATWSTTSIPFGSSAGGFSTFFQFQITNTGGFSPADGLVFVLQPVSSGVGGGGGSIGYGGVTPSVGVEFDTFQNVAFGDPNDNHVGVDVNGSLVSLVSATPGVGNCGAPVGVANCMSNGDVWSVWIDYNGTTLAVAAADNSTTRPANLISYTINIPCILGGGNADGTGCPTPATNAFVGFTAGTGAGYENQDIVDWGYTNVFSPIAGPPSSTPTSPAAVPALSPWALGVLTVLTISLAALVLRPRRVES